MTFWTAVVIIVAIIAVSEVIKSRHRHSNGVTLDRRGNEQQREKNDPALQRRVEELRERVKVLERIATDGRESRLLSDEIEKLRDK